MDPQCINLSGLADQSVSAEVIQPGDVLDVTMITDYTKLTTTTAPVRVADDGSIAVPLVGRVGVGGLEVKQAEQVVNAESVARGVFRTPCITVTMKQCHTSRVTVVGAVNSPGMRELPRGSTSLMAALLAAGGLDKEAGTDVEIRHTDSRQGPQEVLRVDLAAATAGAVQSARTPRRRRGPGRQADAAAGLRHRTGAEAGRVSLSAEPGIAGVGRPGPGRRRARIPWPKTCW